MTALLFYHVVFNLSRTFLKFFSSFINIFFSTAFQVYHNSFFLSRTFFFFFKKNGEGGIWTLAPLLTTYSLSRGAPSASLGTSPNCPRVVILPDNSLHTFVFFIRLFRCFLIEKPCALYRISKLFVKCFLSFFKTFLSTWQAERVGFEPTRPCGQTVFKTASLWPLRYLSVFSTLFSVSASDILSPYFRTVNN